MTGQNLWPALSSRRKPGPMPAKVWGAEKWIPAFAGMTVLLGIAGCTVGPDYQNPGVVVPAAYKEDPGWRKARPADAIDRGAWWSVFRDPILDDLTRQIDISNQNLKAAEAAFRQAEALVTGPRRIFSDCADQ